MNIEVSAIGAGMALLVSILLILRNVAPVYALFVGALIGGLLMSSNPNTVAVSEAFLPAAFGLAITYVLAKRLMNRELPTLGAAVVAPVVTMILLSLRPLFKVDIAPMIALPTGGIVGALVMGRLKQLNAYTLVGLTMAMISTLIFGVFQWFT